MLDFEIIQGLRKLHNHVQDEIIKKAALRLKESEEDLKYQKKNTPLYGKIFKKKSKGGKTNES